MNAIKPLKDRKKDKLAGTRAPRPVFFLSESTGITAEAMGHSLLSQFEGVSFDIRYVPFVNSIERAAEVVESLQAAYRHSELRPIVCATLVDPAIGQRLRQAPCLYLELFDAFIDPLTEELGVAPSGKPGLSHGLRENQAYDARYDTIHFTLANDDGERLEHYAEADIVLVGVSRCGKTPTCLYLAMHFGMRAANYPLTDDDFVRDDLPSELQSVKNKIIALTLDAERLHKVREQRRRDSPYASLDQCRREIKAANRIYARHGLEILDATSHSIEELASYIHKTRKKQNADQGRR